MPRVDETVKRNPRKADEVDAHVGLMIRMQRRALGLSQIEFAARVQISTTQLRKHENGMVRVGAGRLQAIAGVLGVPVSFLFEGAGGRFATPCCFDEELAFFLASAEGRELNDAFEQIASRRLRREVVALVISIATLRTQQG
ncbi:helix-turn-helix domain-containing protein [Ensifer sp. ENS11]|uniref:helix-turn-helix domain-containing protein n=1 Tax=Ensifer sp. ENS11 TaxID=2769291 RepID=UPI00177D4C0E|nr:helix-turn-helix transcriptional regulator [Ensifer sp. ENS11]MBD9489969.1 helix-turn-helix transcriptional regulator [Ensifer sp. ENS11]